MQTDIGLVIAIVGSAVAIVGVVVGMFLWLRGEANNDRRTIQGTQQEDRRDIINFFRESDRNLNEHRKEMNQITRSIENSVQAINNEIMDFHRQLLEIQRKVG